MPLAWHAQDGPRRWPSVVLRDAECGGARARACPRRASCGSTCRRVSPPSSRSRTCGRSLRAGDVIVDAGSGSEADGRRRAAVACLGAHCASSIAASLAAGRACTCARSCGGEDAAIRIVAPYADDPAAGVSRMDALRARRERVPWRRESASFGRKRGVILVLMGVCGCGKTTVGEALARALGWPFLDADDFHPPANVAKMAAGEPLDRRRSLAVARPHRGRDARDPRPRRACRARVLGAEAGVSRAACNAPATCASSISRATRRRSRRGSRRVSTSTCRPRCCRRSSRRWKSPPMRWWSTFGSRSTSRCAFIRDALRTGAPS